MACARFLIVGAAFLALLVGARKPPAEGDGGDGSPAPLAAAADPLAQRVVRADSAEGKLLAEAGTWLLGQMKPDERPSRPGGVRGAWWREFDAHPFTTDSLYGGVAGTVLSLMTLAEMTGDERYADAARRGVRHLIDAAVETPEGLVWDVAWDDREERVHHTRYAGLYTGAAGIAWVLLTYGDAFGDEEAVRAGIRGLDGTISLGRVENGRRTWDSGSYDVIGGTAGIALALLDGWRMTGEERFRKAAMEGADDLVLSATREADGWSWPAAQGQERVYTGASHGVAGIGAALARMHLATGEKRYLDAAEEAARWLSRKEVCLRDKAGVAWRHDTQSKESDRPWAGWCHGPSGTCRLHLLLRSITGRKEYEDTALSGASWILANTDATKDRARSGFWAPSLCCGAAGVGHFLLDVHRSLETVGDHVPAAERIRDWLERIADRPAPGQACWSLSGRPEGKTGETYHGTCLMVGQGGYVTFFARLAQERQRIVREVFVPPDLAAPGNSSGRRQVILECGKGAERFRRVARRLASYRGCERERLGDVANPDTLRDLLRRTRADAVAIVLAPETLDVNLNRRVLHAVCRVDDDVFPDATYGYLTGADPEHARAMLDRMAAVEADGVPPRGVSFGTSPSFDKATVYPASPPEDGFTFTSVYLPLVERARDVRSFVPGALARTAGAGIVEVSGNGDAMRIWLFSDHRNVERERWWPYAPERVLRDFAHPAMPGIGAPDLASFDLAGKLVWFSTCHSGEPSRTIAIGDVVATFGDTGRVVRFHEMRPGESLCLAILARAPAAFLAPVGANHGWPALVERRRAVRERLAMGEAIHRNQIDVALAYGPPLGIPLVQQEEGKPESVPDVPGAHMREGLLNRVLFGDPGFSPLRGLKPGVAESVFVLERVGVPASKKGEAFVVRGRVTRDDHLESWDPYAGPGLDERLVGTLPLLEGEEAVASVAFAAQRGKGMAPRAGVWAVERRRGQTSMLWIRLNGPRTKEGAGIASLSAEFDLAIRFEARGRFKAGGEIVRGPHDK